MKWLLIAIWLMTTTCLGTENLYPLDTAEQQQLFKRLTHAFRCLVCQNQNLADSTAGLARDLRQQILLQIQAGKTQQQITDYMTARYGHYILFRPAFNLQTALLWLGPFILLLLSLYALLSIISQPRSYQ